MESGEAFAGESSEDFAEASSEAFAEESSEAFAEESSEAFAEESSSNETKSSDPEPENSDFNWEAGDENVFLNTAVRTPLPSKVFPQSSSESVQQNSNPIGNICNKYCHENCSQFVSSMSEEVKKEMISRFQGPKKCDVKNKLLEHLKSQKILGLDSSSYIFHSHTFCVSTFSNVTGTSPYLAIKVMRDFKGGYNQYIHGSSAVQRASLANVNFISWMISFSEIHGQSDPVKITTVLPAFLSKAELYKIYLTEASKPLVKSSTFYFLMKKVFGVNRRDKGRFQYKNKNI